jgi:aryl-alcohol dehydrogenase-like predicted oxidoreductase
MMKKIRLGNTDKGVSALCLGSMYFGTKIPAESSFRLLDRYVEAGGDFVDTANLYACWVEGFHGGESESLLGKWMRDRRNRDGLFLATKVGATPTVRGGDTNAIEGLSSEAIERAIDASLERLGTDRIDLYYAHIDDRKVSLEETLSAFDRLVRAGKVRFIGCSNMVAWRIEEAHDLSRKNQWEQYCCVRQRYTYLRPRLGVSFGLSQNVTSELLDFAQAHGNFTILAYTALLNGAYTRVDRPIPDAYAGPDAEARLAVLHQVAQEHGATPNQVVLAWMLQHTPPVLPLIAASTLVQLEENLDALKVTLSERQMRQLNEAAG